MYQNMRVEHDYLWMIQENKLVWVKVDTNSRLCSVSNLYGVQNGYVQCMRVKFRFITVGCAFIMIT